MNIERYLPRQLKARFAVLALGCAGFLFLITAPAIVGLGRMLLFEREALMAHEYLEVMISQGDGELRAIRQQAMSLTDTLEQWEPKGNDDWFRLLEFAIGRLPKADTIRVAFEKESPLGPQGVRGLYVKRLPGGQFERGGITYDIDDPDGPAGPWFGDLKSKKPSDYADGLWSRPHTPPESNGKKVMTTVAPVVQSESEMRTLAGVVAIDVTTETIRDSIKSRMPLKRHMAFIVNADRRIALATREEPGLDPGQREEFATEAEARPEMLSAFDAIFDASKPVGWFVADNPINGEPTCFLFDEFPHNSSKFVLAVPVRDLEGDWYGMAAGVGLLGVLTMTGMALLLRWTAGLATRNLDILRKGVANVRAGNLRAKLPGGVSHDETADIIDAFNGMVGELDVSFQRAEDLARRQQRAATEMDLARRIQRASLPEAIFAPGCELFAQTLPAQEIGGDFYEYFLLPGGRVAIALGDVSGKGVSAALFAARAGQLLRGAAATMGPAEAITHINAQLSRSNPEMMFVTLFFAVWEPTASRIEWVNAGHNPPFLIRRDGRIERLSQRGGPAIGPVRGLVFTSCVTEFCEGDQLTVFTDGITEAPDASGDQFGEERLSKLLVSSRGEGLAGQAAPIVDAACAWQPDGDRFDDITLLLARAVACPAIGRYPASLTQIEPVVDAVRLAALGGGMGEAEAKEIGLATCEAVTNIIQYALAEDASRRFLVLFGWSGDSFIARFEDDGPPFDPDALPMADVGAPLDRRPVGGLGWFLIRKATDCARVERVGQDNILTLVRRRDRPTLSRPPQR